MLVLEGPHVGSTVLIKKYICAWYPYMGRGYSKTLIGL